MLVITEVCSIQDKHSILPVIRAFCSTNLKRWCYQYAEEMHLLTIISELGMILTIFLEKKNNLAVHFLEEVQQYFGEEVIF
uniref:Uncharacterized protein n=1 Tax=Oryza brachyantha TaxID=4533 RepID=J3MF43_ORYBR